MRLVDPLSRCFLGSHEIGTAVRRSRSKARLESPATKPAASLRVLGYELCASCFARLTVSQKRW